MGDSIFSPNTNAWKVCQAKRAALYIDAADYYASLYQNLRLARRSIFILGWDIDSRLCLLPGDPRTSLATVLNGLAEAQESLQIYLLLWDFAGIYLLDREAFQSIKFGLVTHPRVHFCFDDKHPVSASHHQKIVVIDDQMAYSGGIDLTGFRWDTSRHLPRDPRRLSPGGKVYPPFHDCQMGVTGEPARFLGDLCRERWLHCTGQRLDGPWPNGALADYDLGPIPWLEPELAIARTEPAYQGRPEVREVERLFIDMIDAASKYIYIENQYFTSGLIVEHLAAALSRAHGPEVVLVLPKVQDSWLAKLTMGSLSTHCINLLRERDPHHRFHAVYPEDARLSPPQYINVHSKVMVVDDRYVRVGSANLNNRSMGLDTECDLVVDGHRQPEMAHRVLIRLIADHTGSNFEDTRAALARHELIRDAIYELNRTSPKTLERFSAPRRSFHQWLAKVNVVDLDQAHPVEQLVDDFVFVNGVANGANVPRRVPAGLFLTFVFCITMASLLAFAPLFGDLRGMTLDLVEAARGHGVVAAWPILLAFAVGGVAFIPVNLLVVAVASVLPTWGAFLYIMGGSLAGALVGYGAGALLGREALRRFFPRGEAMMRANFNKRGLASMLLVRFFPLAPFSLVNLLSGALRVDIWPYVVGTILGMLPGTIGLVFFQKSLLSLIANPNGWTVTVFIVVTVVITRAFSFLSRRFGRLARRETHA